MLHQTTVWYQGICRSSSRAEMALHDPQMARYCNLVSVNRWEALGSSRLLFQSFTLLQREGT